MSSSTSSGQATKETATRFFDVSLKVLSILVLPVIIWAVKLEVKNAIQDERIGELQEDLAKLSDVTNVVQANSLALVRLEGKLDNVDEKIDEVKKLLRDRGQ